MVARVACIARDAGRRISKCNSCAAWSWPWGSTSCPVGLPCSANPLVQVLDRALGQVGASRWWSTLSLRAKAQRMTWQRRQGAPVVSRERPQLPAALHWTAASPDHSGLQNSGGLPNLWRGLDPSRQEWLNALCQACAPQTHEPAMLQKDMLKDLNNYGLSSRSWLQLTRWSCRPHSMLQTASLQPPHLHVLLGLYISSNLS